MKIEGNLNAGMPNVAPEVVHTEVPKKQEVHETHEVKVQEPESVLTEEKRKAIEEFLQRSLKETNPDLEIRYTERKYEIHDATNRIMVTIVDPATDKVILEIPEKKFLDIIAGIWEAAGLVIDERR